MVSKAELGVSRVRTLVLTLVYPSRAAYYDDWRDAFCESPEFDCQVENLLHMTPSRLAGMVEDFDAIIMLHSCNSDTLEYFAPIAPILGERKRAKLLSFVGNEFNSPYVSLLEKVRLFTLARCDVVATQLLAEAGTFLYGGKGLRIISVPHALNPKIFKPGPAFSDRCLDIGVKGYRYPAFLGDDDRNGLIGFFRENADRFKLNVDISEDNRLSRTQWAAFLARCRATISTETGSWYLEQDDARITRIHSYLKQKRSSLTISNQGPLRGLARRLPWSVKSTIWGLLKRSPVKFEIFEDFKTPFSELHDLFFRDAEPAPVYGKAISSRHFDAIGTKTCQIMLRGRFNDILTPDEHYIALDPDYANAADAVLRLKDWRSCQRIVDQALDHVLSAHTYRHRAAQVRAELEGVDQATMGRLRRESP